MTVCNEVHHQRLFIGEAGFKGVWSLLEKHKKRHPNLGQSIFATTLDTFDRTSDDCPTCLQKYINLDDETRTGLSIGNLFKNENEQQDGVFCHERCERIHNLKHRGVTVILGYDGTKIHRHPQTRGRIFERIHWNCPHDRSDFRAQTLPALIKNFFGSCAQIQKNGHRIHVTLAQPQGKSHFYQGFVYNIKHNATTNGYRLYAKRPFGSERYPDYKHEQTGSESSTPNAERLREFVFIKGSLPVGRTPSRCKTGQFYNTDRKYYTRDTDNESSEYSDKA